MSRLRLLDLFCCAGGAGMGYHRAGFEVVGVDIAPQPNYPFEFHQGDALKYLAQHGHEFDVVHLSPPCQGYTTMSNKHRTAQAAHPRLIEPARAAAVAAGLPYVIENVAGARRAMHSPMKLSGGMFGLGVDRPRLFESNVPLTPPRHRKADSVVGVYGPLDGRLLWTRRDGTQLRAARTLAEGQRAMGIDWMRWHELTEAIPPAYTEHIGRQLLAHLTAEVAA
jgi:DNA (cytosine-5)-methyltransferase 1